MSESSHSPLTPEYLKRLREIANELDVNDAPSLARAASHWDDDNETLVDMVHRGVAIDLGSRSEIRDATSRVERG